MKLLLKWPLRGCDSGGALRAGECRRLVRRKDLKLKHRPPTIGGGDGDGDGDGLSRIKNFSGNPKRPRNVGGTEEHTSVTPTPARTSTPANAPSTDPPAPSELTTPTVDFS